MAAETPTCTLMPNCNAMGKYTKIKRVAGLPVKMLRAETVDGEVLGIPEDANNRHYVEVMEEVEAGEVVIEDAPAIPTPSEE